MAKWLWCGARQSSPSCLSPNNSKIHVANIGPTWVLSAPDGPHFGPMNLAMGMLWYILWNWLWHHGTIQCQESWSTLIHWMRSLIARFMGPTRGAKTWGPQDPGGPHVGPMNIAIWDMLIYCQFKLGETHFNKNWKLLEWGLYFTNYFYFNSNSMVQWKFCLFVFLLEYSLRNSSRAAWEQCK